MADTMDGFTWPRSTMRAMSTVSASVTRSPSRNSGTLPSRVISSLICGPAAVHHDGPHADRVHQHDVLGEQRQGVVARPASARALPPYFTTTIRAGEAPDVGQRLDEGRGLLAGPARPRQLVPLFSSM